MNVSAFSRRIRRFESISQHLARTAGIAVLMACLTAVGCGKRSVAAPDQPKTQTRLDIEGVFEPMSDEALALYQPHVRLGARYSKGYVYVAVRNRTSTPIRIEPANFGIIPRGEAKSIVPVPPRFEHAEFPRMVLDPGEVATGRFRFPGMGDLTGHDLFFRHPKVRSSLCRIRPES